MWVMNLADNRFEEICSRISYIYNNKVPMELDHLEELFVEFTKLLFMRVFNINREPIVEIADGDKYAGCYNGYTTFSVNREQLKKFQNGMALDLFETICHELAHFAQKKDYQSINIKNSIIEKDAYLKEKIEGYYDSNYDFLMTEIDAYLSQGKDAMAILHVLGIIPSEEEIEISNQLRTEYAKNAMITNRIIDEEILDLNEVFEKTFMESSLAMDDFDRTNFLEFRPCINIEYKIVDGTFIRRNVGEIEELYSNWQKGEMQLQGRPNEIDAYFVYTINNLNIFEQKQSKTG